MDTERQYRNLFAFPIKVAFSNQFKPRHWCFLEPTSESTCWNGNPRQPKEQWDGIALQMVDFFKCHTSHPIFPTTEPFSLGQLRKGRRNYHFQGTSDNKKLLIKTILESELICIYNRICQCMRLKIRNLHREQRKTKSKSISNPSS